MARRTDSRDMRQSRISLLALACAAALAPSALGTTYYVRTSGNNASSGTSPANAWATVHYASTIANAGDIVYVGGGTYTGTIAPNKDGTSGNLIRFIADTSGAQTGDAGTVTLKADSGHVIDMTNDDYLSWDGFTIDGNTSSDAIDLDSSVGAVFENLTIIEALDGFDINNGSSMTVTNCTMSNMGEDGIDVDASTATISTCVISDWGSDDTGIEVDNGSTVTVSRCRLFNGYLGIWVTGTTATITNCVLHDLTNHGVLTESGTTVDVVGSTFADVGADGVSFSGTTKIYNCIFYDIGDDCMDKSSGSISTSVNLCYLKGGSQSEGFDSTEIAQDPLFVDYANDDLRLQATSPAIDAGTDQSSYSSVDYIGGSRPQAAGWDLGAYEYGASTITPADIPYVQDFEGSVDLDAWDNTITETATPLTTFLGRFSDDTSGREAATLHVNTTIGVSYTVLVDVYFIDSWDGEEFAIDINGTEVYTVSHDDGVSWDEDIYDQLEMYQELAFWNSSGSGWKTLEALYRHVRVDFTATQAVTEIAFTNTLDQAYDDESLGLDNVRVCLTSQVANYLPRFRGYSIQTGFNYQATTDNTYGAGVHWGDLDNDGDLDAIIPGDAWARRVLNDGDGTFTVAKLAVGQMIRQGALVDLDNDDDLDFWGSSTYYDELLAENDGAAGLTNAGALGFANPHNNEGVAAADVDADGWCDVLVFSENGNWIGHNDGASPIGLTGTNSGSYGINDAGDAGNGDFVSSSDVNGDGHLDFFYHYNGGKLFLSNGDGTFTQNNHGISVHTHNDDKMGSAWGDYDNDGDMDLWVGDNRSGQPGTLWRNDRNWGAGTGSFTNVASAAGLTDTSAHRGCAWGDMDNDGDLDLYIATEGTWANNLLYENQGDGTFVEVAVAEYANAPGNAHDAVFVDYDNDGDLDIAVVQEDNVNTMLRNTTDDSNYLKVRVLGAGGGRANKAAIGTRVELWNAAGDTLLMVREIGVARGLSMEPMWTHFGGVNAASTYLVKAIFPGGDELEAQVTPAIVSTTIGATVIPQMLTIDQAGQGVRAVRWVETAPFE